MVIKSDKNMAPFTDHTIYNHNAPWRQAMPQILAVCVKNILLLGFGMTLGFPTILIPSLSGDNPNETFRLGQEAISWIGSLNLICVPIGCLISGAVTQPLGRRRAMQFVNIPFIISWLLFYFSTEVWQVFLALAIHGVTGGLLEAPVLTYVAEITQPHLRGALSSTSTLSVVSGNLICFLLGTFFKWRTVALISCICPLLGFTLLFFVPETPFWLISKDRFLDARKSLAYLRGWTSLEEIEPEFKEICRHLGKIENERTETVNRTDGISPKKLTSKELLKLFMRKDFLWPLSLVCFVFFIGLFNGTGPLHIYAVKIFATFEAPINKYYATVLLGLVELAGCLICVFVIPFTGKRLLGFITTFLTAVCFLVAATYAHIYDIETLANIPVKINQSIITNSTNQTVIDVGNPPLHYEWIPFSFLLLAAHITHCGIRILPWILVGEVFSTETRAAASGLSAAISYVFGFIASKTFLSMVNTLTLAGTFFIYTVVGFLGTLIMYFILPETEGKTLHDITEHFRGNLKLDNSVYNQKQKIFKGEINSAFSRDETVNNGNQETKL